MEWKIQNKNNCFIVTAQTCTHTNSIFFNKIFVDIVDLPSCANQTNFLKIYLILHQNREGFVRSRSALTDVYLPQIRTKLQKDCRGRRFLACGMIYILIFI